MLTLLVISLTLSAQSPAGALRFAAPPEWQPRQTSSSMRVAEFSLPRVAGDTEDGEAVLYFFGGAGGSVEANIERWLLQMQQPDGKPSKTAARRTERTVNGLAVTMLDISGTYTAEVRPGSTERHNKPGYRMRAAVITTPKGPYFLKVVGPAKTIERWNQSVEAFVGSVRFEATGDPADL